MIQLTHWIPEHWLETLANLRHEIIDTIERWRPWRHHNGATSQGNFPVRYSEPGAAETFWSPSRLFTSGLAMDLDETEDDVVVTADLPGLEPNDFAVEISGERLVIQGEKRPQSHRTEHGYR